MSRIEDTLRKKQGYIGYLTAGDGGLARSKEAMLALVEGGVNILEVGVPFSDPVADGPVIQAASMRALQAGTSLDGVFALIAELKKKTQIPIILFSYYNPILHAGNRVYARAKAAGVDGFLLVDLPIEESDEHCRLCAEVGIDPIFLVSPSTPLERVKQIADQSKGMLYYVTRSGTTGVSNSLPEGLQEQLARIKSITSLPVVAGFGIANQQMAASVLQHADGFVVGSLFVNAVGQGMSAQELVALARSLDPR